MKTAETASQATRPVRCPYCAQINYRASDLNFTHEGPSVYHAGCWRALPLRYQQRELTKQPR